MTASPAMKKYKNNVFITYSFSVALGKKGEEKLTHLFPMHPFSTPENIRKSMSAILTYLFPTYPFSTH